jgi:hypothetical protein
MKTKHLPTRLRELADRIDAAELPDDLLAYIDIKISGVNDTAALAKLAEALVTATICNTSATNPRTA